MVKRKISLFLILIANIIMLADAAIVHHHHESKICFAFFNHNAHDESSHNSQAEGQDKGDCSGCLLKHTVVINQHTHKTQLKYIDFSFLLEGINNTSSIGINSYITVIPSGSNRFIPPLRFLYQVSNAGLRAPPLA